MMISTYDPTNRLIRVQELGYSDVTDYRISASGWRYWSKAGTANAIYSPRDGSAPLGEFTVGSFPFTWTLRRPDGSVYGRKGYSSNNEFFWTDPLGSIRVRTSNSGSLLEAHDYYPFGLDMPGRSSTGTPVRQGFTGYWRDPDGLSACCSTLQGSLRFAMSKDQTYLGTLARADSRGQLNSQIRTDAITVGVAVLDRGINTADAVSTGAEGVAFASSFVKSPQGLAVTGTTMATSFYADVAGAGMSFMKEKLQNSNHTDSRNRFVQVAVGELVTRAGGQRFGARLGPLIGPAFQILTSESSEQGQNRNRPIAPVDNTRTIRRIGDADEN
jgi:hypothetical protein